MHKPQTGCVTQSCMSFVNQLAAKLKPVATVQRFATISHQTVVLNLLFHVQLYHQRNILLAISPS